jgi:thiamine pyrophosphokinase
MSSHHFVKEGQEPALIIANGAMCSFSLLEEMLQWSPYVVALDGAYDYLKSKDIKPDVVIGDFDSIGEPILDIDITVIKDTNQHNTDLEKAIDFLIAKGYTEMNVLGATGRREDHSLNNFLLLCKYSDINIVFLGDGFKAFLVKNYFSKYYKKGHIISLLPIGKVTGIFSENLLYPLNNSVLDPKKQTGCSNSVLDDGTVKIKIKKGFLIFIEIFVF